MSQRPRSTFKSRKRWDDQKSSGQVLSAIAQQLGDEQREEKPPTKSQDVTPDQEREVEGAAVVQEPAPEAIPQELAYPKTGRERGDGPDVKAKEPSDPEPTDNVPEAGGGRPQV
nr:PREDICTED: P antigen family member 3-like [Rhinolophus sinicus]